MKNTIQSVDPEISNAISNEIQRANNGISLIASENYAPEAILEATGSILTNKYAEGYPGARYYSGCKEIDAIETLAIDRCKQLFGAEHANVQPHSGSQANMAVYFAMLNPGDTILGMDLCCGGHLSHGHLASFSGKLYNCVTYTLNKETELLDYEEIAKQAHKHRPKLIIAGASAYSRTIDFKKFAEIAKEVNALLLVDMAHIAGLVAAGLHPSPVPHADFITSTTHKTLRGPRGGFIICKSKHAEAIDRAVMPGMQGGPFMNVIAAKAICFKLASEQNFVEYQKQVLKNAKAMANSFKELGYRIVSGGTDTHMFTIDLRNKEISGKMAEQALEKANIYVNRNCIPFDPERPSISSGIRIGTPAITTQGFKETEAIELVEKIDKVLQK